MVTFSFLQPVGTNFTPATKICEFARKHHLKTSYRYDQLILHYSGSVNTVYHHYEINPVGDGTEKVTIYMEDIKQ